MPDEADLRSRILDAVNMIVTLEGGPLPLKEVRVVAGGIFFDSTFGTTLLTQDGEAVMRVAVERPGEEVVDTILHEAAHLLLGPEHIDQPDHGPEFQAVYLDLKRKYAYVVMEMLAGQR